MGRLTLVLGGQKSGKSSTASRLAADTGAAVVVVTPAAAGDEEMAERIARHQSDRPDDWQTVETFDVAGALAAAPTDACVVVDAFDTWLAHAMGAADLWTDDDVAALGPDGADAAEQVLDQVTAWAGAAEARNGETIIVAGQPGFGLHPLTANGRRYADLHGLSLSRLGTGARVMLVVAGRALELP